MNVKSLLDFKILKTKYQNDHIYLTKKECELQIVITGYYFFGLPLLLVDLGFFDLLFDFSSSPLHK